MARIPVDPNYSFPTFPRATAATDIFVKEDVQALAAAVSTHVHDGAGKGLLVGGPAAGSISNSMLGADVARDNLLTNGGFENWQRGNGPYTGSSIYGADRWQLSGATSTWSVSRIASTIGSNGGSAQISYTHAASGSLSLQQKVESLSQFQGKTVTVSVQVKSTVAGTVRLWAFDGTTLTFGAFNVGTGSERLTLTYPVPAGAADFQIAVQVSVASCTVEVNDAMLVVGSQAANYVPMHPADEIARCLRYYEKIGGVVNQHYAAYTPTGAGQQFGQYVAFAGKKALTPTVTKVGTWTVSNFGQPSANGAGVDGFSLPVVSVAAGIGTVAETDATCFYTAESNP